MCFILCATSTTLISRCLSTAVFHRDTSPCPPLSFPLDFSQVPSTPTCNMPILCAPQRTGIAFCIDGPDSLSPPIQHVPTQVTSSCHFTLLLSSH
ncbi:uncharacterized protein EI90DRAFT_3030756 [Cantharellus anzutake]|uniref:uncharacterized protein n=1 Tax=Cantharellus anzutake TaxID=1750568 RepID=UPI0019080888|nr:uncharacterized protein EI90DRAFT_3030756 [Cantharellus anzutake]KAF8342933.1 hypothetical protein EI90DRAFT_3030756 [Cantharellus anzutake]